MSGRDGGLGRAIAEGALLVALSAAAAFAFNSTRKEPLPLRSDPRLLALGVDLPVLSAADAAKALDAGSSVFLDARDADAFRAGHIGGAFWIAPDEFLERYATIGTLLAGGTQTIVYGAAADPGRVEKLAQALLSAGVTEVSLLLDGYEGWAAAGAPTETGDDPTVESAGSSESAESDGDSLGEESP